MYAQLGVESSPNPLGMGAQVFGGPVLDSSSESSTLASQTESSDNDSSLSALTEAEIKAESESEDSEDEDEDALVAAVASASLGDSLWKDVPQYSPLYLSTVSEYLPAPPKVKIPTGAAVDSDGDKDSKKGGGGWSMEGYENSMEVDHAFERFSKRVSYEGEQCLRYVSPYPYPNHRTRPHAIEQ